jgi:tripartite-type tricarboxylate transporter receptor subunit TctC
MLTALLGGEVDMVIGSLPTVVNYGKTGRANIVAIASKDPAPQLPGVPTVDSVLPGYIAQSWVGLIAPAKLPKDVFHKIQTALAKTLADPAVRKKMTTDGFNIVNSSPTEFEQQVRQEAKRWSELIRAEKITIE